MRFNYYLLTAIIVCISAGKSDILAQEMIEPNDMPMQWQYTEGFDQTSPVADDWWHHFSDATLDSLISLGITNNYDILNAKHRIEMAQQSLRQVQSQYYPTIGISGGWTGSRQSGMTTDVAMDATRVSYFNIGANMNWQIDLFGKITEQSKQSKAMFRATRVQYDGMMVTIAAKIASAYMQLRMLQAEKAVMNRHIAQQQRVTEITQARHEVGLASMLDVSQSLTTYYSTLASITSLDAAINSTVNSIAILIGAYPQDMAYLLDGEPTLPDYHQVVSVGIPMDLLRRRPDVAQAEYTLAGYAAAVGIAKKDFLPTISLTGSIGTTAHKADNLFKDQSLTYSIAPVLSWTLFDGMSRKAALTSAKEQMMIGINNYNSTILTAVQEVDNAMSTYYNDLKYIELISQVVEQAKKSFELSIDLYKQGLTAFINVTNAQISYLQYSNELVTAQGQALMALVNLYEALGGGWSE